MDQALSQREAAEIGIMHIGAQAAPGKAARMRPREGFGAAGLISLL
jgi:hypothetical protein